MKPVQAGQIKVDRAVLQFEIFGQGVPVIVLHGGPGPGYRYLLPELLDSLGDSAQLIFYDQRASGLSTGADTPELLTLGVFMDDLEEVYNALAIHRAILLAHSFGGLLAIQFALRAPERVAGLVLADADPPSKSFWSRYPGYLRAQGPQELRELAAIQSAPDWQRDSSQMARYFELVLKPFFADPSKVPTDFGNRFVAASAKNLFRTGVTVRASLGNWDFYPEVAHISARTLIVRGDQSIYPVEATTKLAKQMPCSAVATLKASAHFPFIESMACFRDAVGGFISSLSLNA